MIFKTFCDHKTTLKKTLDRLIKNKMKNQICQAKGINKG